jgi:signal transduction histidine kinase
MLVELRPAALVEKPLDELLRHLVDAMTGRARVPIDLQAAGDCRLPADVQIAFYRIAQESLNNAVKHANASGLWVSLDCTGHQAHLSVRDDGAGFDPSGALPDRFGVAIMGERAEAIGAGLEIRSVVGHGSEIVLQWTRKGVRADG